MTKTYKPRFLCNVCNMDFASKHSLLRHNRVKHVPNNVRYSCIVCSKMFKRKDYLRAHQRRMHSCSNSCKPSPKPKLSYNCHLCDKVYRSKDMQLDHYDKIHDIRLKNFICFCGKKCLSHKGLNCHFGIKHEVPSGECMIEVC